MLSTKLLEQDPELLPLEFVNFYRNLFKNYQRLIGNSPEKFYSNFLSIYEELYSTDEGNGYFIYFFPNDYLSPVNRINYQKDLSLSQQTYEYLFEKLYKQYYLRNPFPLYQTDASYQSLMGHVIVDKIFARLKGEIEIEYLLVPNKYDAAFGAPLPIEFNAGPPIGEITQSLDYYIIDENQYYTYLNSALLIEKNYNLFKKIDHTHFGLFTTKHLNPYSFYSYFYLNDLVSYYTLSYDLDLYDQIFKFGTHGASVYKHPFNDYSQVSALGDTLSVTDSYRSFTQEIYNAAFLDSALLQRPDLVTFKDYISTMGGEMSNDELIQDHLLIFSLIPLYYTLYTSSVTSNLPVTDRFNGNSLQIRYTPLYIVAVLSGYRILFLYEISTFILMLNKLMLVIIEFYSIGMRKQFSYPSVLIVIIYALIKLKTLMASKFYASAQRQGLSYANNVQLYMYKFVVSRGFEILDIMVNYILPLKYDLALVGNKVFINSEFIKQNAFSSSQIVDEHYRRLFYFVKARNNLIQVLGVRLPYLKELFSRHARTRSYLLNFELEAYKKRINIFNFTQNKSQLIDRTALFSGNFDSSYFWKQAFVLMEAIYQNANDPLGQRKIRFLETILLDWGTMRYLSQHLQYSVITDWYPSFASDNYGLVYGPSNALLFYGYRLNPKIIYPDLDETTLAYDIRNMLRPDTYAYAVEKNKALRTELISNSTIKTVRILAAFAKYFGDIYSSTSTAKYLALLENYAEMRYKFMISALYAIEFFGDKFFTQQNQLDTTTEDFQIKFRMLDQASYAAFDNFSVLEYYNAAGQIQEASISKLETSDINTQREQERLKKRRDLALLILERDRYTDKNEAKFYLNYIQINAVSRLNSAIYTSFVKNSLRGSIESDINLNSPLLLDNTLEVLQKSTKKLLGLGVLKLFDLYASFYNQIKYRLISDDMYIFLVAANRRENILTGLDPRSLEQEQIKLKEIYTAEISQAIRENRIFRQELIRELVEPTNEYLQTLFQRLEGIEQIYRTEVENAAALELELRRNLQYPVVSQTAQQILIQALEETENVEKDLDSTIYQTLRKIEDYNYILVELNRQHDEGFDNMDLRQFNSVKGEFTGLLNSISSRMSNFLFTGQAPLENNEGNLSETQLSKFIDLQFYRISSAVKTRLSTRQQREFVYKLGANGQIRLNSILSNPDVFLSHLRAWIRTEKAKPENEREVTSLIIRILEGNKRTDKKLVEYFITKYIAVL